MSERYWITGVQLGLLKLAIEENIIKEETKNQINEIEENQFIGNMEEPYENYEIVIIKKFNEIGKFLGYPIIEDNNIKELRLPKNVIEFFKNKIKWVKAENYG